MESKEIVIRQGTCCQIKTPAFCMFSQVAQEWSICTEPEKALRTAGCCHQNKYINIFIYNVWKYVFMLINILCIYIWQCSWAITGSFQEWSWMYLSIPKWCRISNCDHIHASEWPYPCTIPISQNILNFRKIHIMCDHSS